MTCRGCSSKQGKRNALARPRNPKTDRSTSGTGAVFWRVSAGALLACCLLLSSDCSYDFGTNVDWEAGVEHCGNGILDPDPPDNEECDDGNQDNTDDCPDDVANGGTCTHAVCGDGFVLAGVEGCDDGNRNNNDDCPDDPGGTPAGTCQAAACGDGFLWNQGSGTEECDDGNNEDGDGCSATCTLEGCGDGAVDPGTEECDDGNHDNTDDCPDDPFADPAGTCRFATCGDGFVRAGLEECDDGNDNTYDACPSGPSGTCRFAVCGDGFLYTSGTPPFEECDDGNGDNNDDCPDGPGGTCLVAGCGDGFLHTSGNPPYEDCEDGNVDSCDGCSNVCGIEECGNRVVDCGEGCDDQNNNNNDSCPNGPGGTCESARCGDGFLWSVPLQYEDCDDGNENNNDDCPDGTAGTCQPAVCGDGFVWAGQEGCEDGNSIDGDGCSSTCQLEYCGNGTVDATGGEVCDDGDQDNSDSCPDGDVGGTCQPARCGDGHVWNTDGGTEQCDDGNSTNWDGCPDDEANGGTCQPAACGDGFIWRTVEECDDGGTQTGDGCDDNCVVEAGWYCTGEPSTCSTQCGDGVEAGAETCDDGNTQSGDGCSAACEVECCNGSTTDCNYANETLNATAIFVDPDPPAGFCQCAGFINTTQDDVGPDWEANCLGQARILRIRYWDTSGTPWILLGDATLDPTSLANYQSQTFDAVDNGGTEGVLSTQGVTMLKDDPLAPPPTVIVCNTPDPNDAYGANDLYFANRSDTSTLFVCSGDDDLNPPLCGEDQELVFAPYSMGQCQTPPGNVTQLAIALYLQIN